jgi:hypothetical protein
MVNANQEALWLRYILLEFGFDQHHPTSLWCDNQSAIKLTKYLVQHHPNKHIDIHMHFIRNLIHDQFTEVLFFPTEDQVANIFTNYLIEEKFSKLRSMLGVQEVIIKAVYALMPPSFSYCVNIVNVGQLRGGVNQLLPCLNNYASFKLFAETLNDDHIKAGK